MEDDSEISELVANHLNSEGYMVSTAYDGEKALEIFEKDNFDLILLDLMLPKINGKEVMKKIRGISGVPILIISDKDKELDKILGLELGADDYITKPFSVFELSARIQAIVRRMNYYSDKNTKVHSISRGALILDLNNYVLLRSGEAIGLTAKEFDILRLFFENPIKVFTKAQIFNSVLEEDFLGDDNNVMVHIRRLREKIEEDPSNPKYIKTIWGIGYKLGDF